MKKKYIFTSLAIGCACALVGVATALTTPFSANAETKIIETALVQELEDVTGKKLLTQESNGRVLGDFSANCNRAISMQIDLSSNTGYKGEGGAPTLGLSFFGPTTGETNAGNGHIGALNYQFIMDGRASSEYPNGSMSLVYYTTQAEYVTVAQPECVYNKELIDFEFGSCAIKTGDEWTGNYLYVKIDGETVLEARDTGAYYNTKSTCVSVSESDYGKYHNGTVFLSNNVQLDEATVYDYKDLTGQDFGDYVSQENATEAERKLGEFPQSENVAVTTWIKRTGTEGDHWYGGLSILESSFGANDGYYLDCDWEVILRTKVGDVTYDTDDVLSKNSKGNQAVINYGAIGETDGFVVEFGVRSVKESGERIGNYVYFTVDGKLIHGYFDDSDDYNKTGRGVSLTWKTNVRNYQFATVPSSTSLTKIRTAYNAIKILPDMTSIALTDKTDVENARLAYDALTKEERLYVVNETRLLNAERQLWLVIGDAKPDEVEVYDLFDINGDKSNAYMSLVTNPDQLAQIQEAVDNGLAFNGRKLGLIQETSNIAFRTRITYEWYVQSKLFIELYIMQKSVTANATDYGYRLWWKDGNIEIQYDANPLVAGEGDNTVGARVTKDKVTALVGEDVQNADEEFILEFGCAKYIAYNVWQGNYVYVKVNGVEIISFVDSGEFYKDKGKIVANGNYNTWHLYTFNSLYDFIDITMGDVPVGATFSEGETHAVPLCDGAKLLLPTKNGYEISSALLDGVDVTDKIILTTDGYALDCSDLTVGGTLTVNTAEKQVSVDVKENSNVEIDVATTADIRSILQVKLATEIGYVLTSFTINGEEYIDEVVLEKDGYYYFDRYRLQGNVELSTIVAEKSYTVSVQQKGNGDVTAVERVGAFGGITVTLTPTEGNVIKGVMLNGKPVNVSEDGTITIERVTENIFLDVRFTEKPLPVDTTANVVETTKNDGKVLVICAISFTALIALGAVVVVVTALKKKNSNE